MNRKEREARFHGKHEGRGKCSLDSIFGGGGGTTQTNTVTNSDPWSGVQPYLQDIFQRGANLTVQNPAIAPQSANTLQAQGLLAQRAQAGNPLVPAAQQGLMKTINGDYLDLGKNPAWDAITKRMTDAYQTGTAANLDSRFGKSGNAFMDNSAYQQMRGQNERAFGDALGGVAGNLYGQERGLQMNAIGAAPGMAAADYADPTQLAAVGGAQDARAQQVNQSPWDQLFNYQRAIAGSGATGGSSSQSGQQPYFSNPLGSALGMGIGGLGLYNGLGAAGLLGSTAAGAGAAAGAGDLLGTMMMFA